MIPLSSVDWDPLLPAWRRAARRIRRPRAARHRTAALYRGWPHPRFWQLIARELTAMPKPYLAFAVRSDAPIRPRAASALEGSLAALRRDPLVERLAFVTPDAIVG
jgi:hypothetical protein